MIQNESILIQFFVRSISNGNAAKKSFEDFKIRGCQVAKVSGNMDSYSWRQYWLIKSKMTSSTQSWSEKLLREVGIYIYYKNLLRAGSGTKPLA